MCVCVCGIAEGLSQPRSSADGWRDPDLSAAPARCERTLPRHPAERAGEDGGARKTQPHAGSLLLLLLTTNHENKVAINRLHLTLELIRLPLESLLKSSRSNVPTQRLSVSEIIIRSAKHIFRTFLQVN